MEIVVLVVLVVLVVGGVAAAKRAGWFDGVDDSVVERARGSQTDQSVGPYDGL